MVEQQMYGKKKSKKVPAYQTPDHNNYQVTEEGLSPEPLTKKMSQASRNPPQDGGL